MGIFSDNDINEAERLVEKSLEEKVDLREKEKQEKEKIKLEFLTGFEEGYKRAKNTEDLNYFEKLPLSNMKPLHGYFTTNMSHEARKFGFGYGLLVGIIRFHPVQLVKVRDRDYFPSAIKLLKTYHPEYYQMIGRRLKRWDKKIKSIFEELNKEEKTNYLYFIRHI